jgi:hypothetical protein
MPKLKDIQAALSTLKLTCELLLKKGGSDDAFVLRLSKGFNDLGSELLQLVRKRLVTKPITEYFK